MPPHTSPSIRTLSPICKLVENMHVHVCAGTWTINQFGQIVCSLHNDSLCDPKTKPSDPSGGDYSSVVVVHGRRLRGHGISF